MRDAMTHALTASVQCLAVALAMAAPFLAVIGAGLAMWHRQLAAFEADAASVLDRQGRGQC